MADRPGSGSYTEALPLLISLAGLALTVVAIAVLALTSREGAYRVGPWPGLAPRGAIAVLGHALFLAGVQLLLGTAEGQAADRAALPYLPAVTVAAVLPLTRAAMLMSMPGVATAVCGVYLLARSLVSVVAPALAPPPLLLPAAMAMDVALWAHSRWLGRVLPRSWPSGVRKLWSHSVLDAGSSVARTVMGGGFFGLVLGLVDPGYEVLIGAPRSGWEQSSVGPATVLAVVAGALAGWLAGTSVLYRRRGPSA